MDSNLITTLLPAPNHLSHDFWPDTIDLAEFVQFVTENLSVVLSQFTLAERVQQ